MKLKNIPNMGQIILDPKKLLNFIYKNGWIVTKPENFCELYDGTNTGLYNGAKLEISLFTILKAYNFIDLDSGNWDYHEKFWIFNNKYENVLLTNKHLLNSLQTHIISMKYKDKYKNLIREHKIKIILNE